MQTKIEIKIKTLSNLFIGGSPKAFEIGGIDMYTVTTSDGKPYIPASTLKGALRGIVHERQSDKEAKRIAEIYSSYIENEMKKKEEMIKKLCKDEMEVLQIKKRYDKAINDASAESLFGIEGFSNVPSLLFEDLHLCENYSDRSECFSIDAKNTIEINDEKTISNPRTYKTIRKGIELQGKIHLYKIEQLGEEAVDICIGYISTCLEMFNQGIYRLGNSKSRGYGRIEVDIKRN